jgi:hypothetical protein
MANTVFSNIIFSGFVGEGSLHVCIAKRAFDPIDCRDRSPSFSFIQNQNMKQLLLLTALLITVGAQAQVDTFDTHRAGLETRALRDGKTSYAVLFTDSLGNRLSSADIWDRSITVSDSAGRSWYRFHWQWWRKDTLIADVHSVGDAKTLQPLWHDNDYRNRGHSTYLFQDTIVTMAPAAQHTAKDSAFRVALHPPAFAFPMDLELFPLLPFKKPGSNS